MSHRKTVNEILEKKKKGERITMLTAYDYPMARLIDEVGIDIILVGDSLANVVLGLESTKEIGMEEMLHHARAVNRGVTKALLVGDMPFGSFHQDSKESVRNAALFIEDAGCNAVKLEWYDNCLVMTKAIVDFGIPVMGHIGLTPQTADQLGGFIVQGRDHDTAQRLIEQARSLQKAGCFSIVLECVPDKLSEIITKDLDIPTIGIGAGIHCDGQVLVTHDILGLYDRFRPKFVKQYTNLSEPIKAALESYKKDVELGHFPSEKYSFSIKKEELEGLL